MLPDGQARALGAHEVTSAVISDDGRQAWYATGSRDGAGRQVFRSGEADEAVLIGSGDHVQLSYVGGAFPRLLGLGRSGERGVDLYADDAEGELALVAEVPDAVYDSYAVNPASGTLYLSMTDPEQTEDEDDGPPTGALLSLRRDATDAVTVAEGHERFGQVAPAADDGAVAFVVESDEISDLLVRTGDELLEIDRAPVIPSLFLDPDEELLHYSTRDDDDEEVARRVPADGSAAPVDLLEDVSWAAVPGAVRALPWEYAATGETRAAVDDGARQCAADGIPVVDPFPAGHVDLPAGREDVCVRVPDASSVSLSAVSSDGEDLTMTVTGHGEEGSVEVATDDDSGGGSTPLVTTTLERGTYRITVEPYASWSGVPSGYRLQACRGPVGTEDPCGAVGEVAPA